MPQALPAIAMAAAEAAGLTALQTFAVVAGVTLVSGLVQAQMADDMDMPSFDMAAAGAGLKVNTRSTQEP